MLQLLLIAFLLAGAAVPAPGSLAARTPPPSAWRNVTHLPGFDGPLPFTLQTGYIEINAESGDQMFAYFIPSQGRPDRDPLILWMTGGPGCSSITALMFENGPLAFDYDDYTGGFPPLFYNPQTWTNVSNIIFVDAPIGTGFSYSNTTNDEYKANEFMQAHQVFVFLTKWLEDRPEFRSNPLYIAGDSFGGRIVPLVMLKIAESNEARIRPSFNLKGYIVGNPITNRMLEEAAAVDFRHGMALIPDELYKTLRKTCNGNYISPTNHICIRSINTMNEIIKNINPRNILEPYCEHKYLQTIQSPAAAGRREMLAHHAVDHSFLKSDVIKCRNYAFELVIIWANDDRVREALGVHKETVPSWLRCNRVQLQYDMVISDAAPYHLEVLKRGYRALVYSGDHDSVAPFMSTEAWIKSFNFSIVDEWRPWYADSNVVAGFTRTYSDSGTITFATVKGAGHVAPSYKPKECVTMFERWIASSPL